ncbi:Hydroxyproline-rich glycoprotein family protein [Rhynchospora pubera]|uniref:Hydroxyproline-rich glycoprotein family protein n=1 Tax=Rhynchospora pubera TaxID=906938 RepID=A0AAV8GK21_9POAL|nr:Hydroxyproline-rich glycoprotein family protein [Rhynchospora pubera]
MVAGKVKAVMGFQRSSPSTPKASTPKAETPRRSSASPAHSTSGKNAASFARSFGVYFPKSNSQVQPRPPDVADLLKVIEDLQERESRLRTELIEQKIMRETVAIVPFLEAELDHSKEKVKRLEMENLVLREEAGLLRSKEERYREMEKEIECLKKKLEAQRRDQDECSSSSSSSSSINFQQEKQQMGETNSVSPQVSVPKPPPLPSYSFPKSYRPSTSSSSSSSSSSTSSSSSSSVSNSTSEMSSVSTKHVPKLASLPPIPPPPPPMKEPLSGTRSDSGGPPPPPPPPPPRRDAKGGGKGVVGPCVRRAPEVVEFYHSLMRRESKRESGGGSGGNEAAPATVCPRDMIGEIENRSAHLLAIKTDVETQGDFIRFLIKEVEGATFTKIEDVVSFVKWLDDELSCLVDERAVLKHFDWPEQKADALREAAFGYCDLKKLETEASSFRDDSHQPCSSSLKKMQALFEKLEHGVYNLARIREGAMNRYRGFRIPWEWMQETGIVSQIKLASVKLAMKYMKRVSAELEVLAGGPDEEELMLQAVRFAFRVHQFAGGFDVDTMSAFQELKEKVSLFHIHCQSQNQQHQQRLVCRST